MAAITLGNALFLKINIIFKLQKHYIVFGKVKNFSKSISAIPNIFSVYFYQRLFFLHITQFGKA